MANWDYELTRPKKKRKFIHFKDMIIEEDEKILVINKPAGFSTLAL